MASLYKRDRSPFWWIEYLDERGKRIQESTGKRFDSVQQSREARQMRAAKEMVERSCAPAERGEKELRHWVPRWLATTYAQQPLTLENYEDSFEKLMTFFEEQKVRTASQITRKMCFDYLDWRIRGGVCRNTGIHDLRKLRLILNEALNRDLISKNPASKMGLKADPVEEKPEITDEQRAIVEGADLKDWQRTSWLIAINQGCRLAETSLPLKRVDFDHDTITFKLKGGRLHTTKLLPSVKSHLWKLKEEGHTHSWGPFHRNASRDWQRTLQDLGLTFTFHSTRVTVITRLARSGVNQQQAIRFIGHCSSEVHAIYTRLKVEDLSACADALDPVTKASDLSSRSQATDKPGQGGTLPPPKRKIGRPAIARRG